MSQTVTVSIARLPHAAGLELPAYQTPHAAGMDLFAAVNAPMTLQPGQRAAVPCGFVMALPEGFEAQIRPRSGLALKSGISVPNAPGTIDADYRGEVKAILINLSQEPFVISRGMRIAQMVVAPVSRAVWSEVADPAALSSSARGTGGFGSTGH